MSDDIVTRLREQGCPEGEVEPCGYCLSCKAADEIELLRNRVNELESEVRRLETENSKHC